MDNMTQLCLCTFVELVEEMEKRGTFVMGVILESSEGEEPLFFVKDNATVISAVALAEGLLEYVQEDDDFINTDFDLDD